MKIHNLTYHFENPKERGIIDLNDCAKKTFGYSCHYLNLVKKYHKNANYTYLEPAWFTILAIEKLSGKRIQRLKILDLGCGGKTSKVKSMPNRVETNEPWFCRLVYSLGGNPIGVDMADLSKEKFIGYSVDITKPESLQFIADDSIDVATAIDFFDSPSIPKRNVKKISQNVLENLDRILKPQGLFLISDNIDYYDRKVFPGSIIVRGSR